MGVTPTKQSKQCVVSLCCSEVPIMWPRGNDTNTDSGTSDGGLKQSSFFDDLTHLTLKPIDAHEHKSDSANLLMPTENSPPLQMTTSNKGLRNTTDRTWLHFLWKTYDIKLLLFLDLLPYMPTHLWTKRDGRTSEVSASGGFARESFDGDWKYTQLILGALFFYKQWKDDYACKRGPSII